MKGKAKKKPSLSSKNNALIERTLNPPLESPFVAAGESPFSLETAAVNLDQDPSKRVETELNEAMSVATSPLNEEPTITINNQHIEDIESSDVEEDMMVEQTQNILIKRF